LSQSAVKHLAKVQRYELRSEDQEPPLEQPVFDFVSNPVF